MRPDRREGPRGPRPGAGGPREAHAGREGPRGPRPGAGGPRATAEAHAEPLERLVAGLQPVREAIRVHGSRLLRVAVEASDQPRLTALVRFAKDNGVATVARLPRGELDGLTGSTAHQGAVAWAPPLVLLEPDAALPGAGEVTVALDKIQDPQNFGAVIRSAVALGGVPVVWGEHASAPLTPATFRASAGAVEHARLCRVPSLPAWLSAARERDIAVIGLDAQADTLLASVDLSAPTVLVIGSEHDGLARSVRHACTRFVALAPRGAIDSLNASAAAAIALYEARIQRLKTRG